MILIFLNQSDHAPLLVKDNHATSALLIISQGSLKICSLFENKVDWSSPIKKAISYLS
jgi:hypothetical protein